VSKKFFALVNPAAGGGRSAKFAAQALDELRKAGIEIESIETRAPGDGISHIRKAWARGFRKFLAVGGDGTSYEIVNGLFPAAQAEAARPTLAFLPLGTGNSFLRDFSDRGVEYARASILENRSRPCDVIKLTHRDGVLHYINLLSIGFAADVAAVTNRRLKPLGPLGYWVGILICLARLDRRVFPLRVDGAADTDRRRCLFLSFNNSKFTGGKMMIAPDARTDDGLIEFVRWGPIGRLALLRNLHTLYDGTHLKHPLAERGSARRIDFELNAPVDVMVDGESLTLHCQALEVLPGALDVVA